MDLLEGLVGFSKNLSIERLINGTYEVMENSSGTSVELPLLPLTTSDAGTYRCFFDLRNEVIGYQKTFVEFLNITISSK